MDRREGIAMIRRAFLTLVLCGTVLTLPSPALAGGGGCVEVTEGTGSTVELLNYCITPTVLRVEPGETVTFVNRDETKHVLSSSGYAWGSDGYMRTDEAFTATFSKNGVYPYQCYLHPGMAGAVVVGDGSGLGAAERGGVVASPLQEPLPEVVYVTRAPEVRTVTASSGGPVAWAGGIVVGLVIGVIVTLGLRSSARRRASEVPT
jgi:plastocyanin